MNRLVELVLAGLECSATLLPKFKAPRASCSGGGVARGEDPEEVGGDCVLDGEGPEGVGQGLGLEEELKLGPRNTHVD